MGAAGMSIRPTNDTKSRELICVSCLCSMCVHPSSVLVRWMVRFFGGVFRSSVDAFAPRFTILRQLAPLLEFCRQIRAFERLVQRMSVRELGTPVRPRVEDPFEVMNLRGIRS